MADYLTEDEQIPLAQCDQDGPFRCLKCGAYVNPGFSFVDGCTQLACNLCGQFNKIGNSKYSYNPGQKDHTEFVKGMYEFEVGG